MNAKRALVGLSCAVVVSVGAPFVYFRVVQRDQPAPLQLSDVSQPSPAAGSTTPGSSGGTWTVANGSQVGYRVKEVAFGQRGEAVGRTSAVTGSLTADGATITTATFTADMTTVRSDQSRRDNQFRGRIMDVASHPKATFTLTKPIVIESLPDDGVTVTKTVTGDLTLRGRKKPVTFTVTGQRAGGRISVSGSIPIVFAEWNIPNPSFGPITTEENGVLEFAIAFTQG